MSDLRQAIDTMNAQPDISVSDSPRLRELCRLTAMEVKAVGSVSAATSLGMIAYIRELERGQNGYVAWCRYKYNSEGGIQSIVTCDSDAKGAFKVYPAARPSLSDAIKEVEKMRDVYNVDLHDTDSDHDPVYFALLGGIVKAFDGMIARLKSLGTQE